MALNLFQISSFLSVGTGPIFFHSAINSSSSLPIFAHSLGWVGTTAILVSARSISTIFLSKFCCLSASMVACSAFFASITMSDAALKRFQISSEISALTGPVFFQSSWYLFNCNKAFLMLGSSFNCSARLIKSIFNSKFLSLSNSFNSLKTESWL